MYILTIRWRDELRAQTQWLLMYPAIVAFFVLAAVVFSMSYLVPQMVPFLQNMGQELPLNTKILIAASNAFVTYWLLVLGLPLLILILLASIIRNGALARYFSLMHKTDIPVLDAIEICEKIVANRVIADALSRAHAMINAGNSMSESFRNAGLFPALVVRMINVGESTGALDKSLLNISYFYDRDVNAAMQKMLKIIEPLLTLILGAILAFIMFSVLGPVYDSFSKLKL